MSPDAEDELIGTVFDGRYRVLEHLADGGMARVYLAMDLRLDREVALKVLRPHLGQDDEFVRRFEREARVAARLQHPHIVSVFDQGREHGRLYIAMEYVPGRTLREVLETEGALTPRAALDLMAPVLQALGHAHRLGDIHRDIKPENVLIRDDGVVKVTDFGLTRAVSSQTVTSASGILLGTVAYVSPEQVGRGVADERSDVYAAGLVLFELLTGEKAFAGDVPLNVAFQHVHQGAPLVSSVVPGVPEPLDELVADATAMDPDERPKDALDFRDRLRATKAALSDQQLDRRLVTSGGAAGTGGGGLAPTPHDGTARPGQAATTAYPIGRGDRTQRLPAQPNPTPAPPKGPGKGAGTAVTTRKRWPWVLAVLAAALLAATVWAFTAGPLTPTPVPPVAGQTLAAADAALKKVGLTHRDTEEFSETVEKGVVIDSTPKAGVTNWKFAPVTLRVSKGPERYAVPTLAGIPLDTAKAQIIAAKLSVGTVTEAYDEKVTSGSVISSDPGATSPLPPNGAVNLVVSKGRQPVEFADWTGKSADEASKALADAGLKVDASEHQNSESVPKGSVISQTPPSGELFKGDGIKLVVSDGPPLVEVPDVFGKQVGNATDILEKAGFKVKVEAVLGGVFGTVRSQDPAAGTSVPKGSTITIRVV
ncbi:MAG TPA: Stk1 family PASTA domain-containing Ser/Thr kinase [Phycicoccus sp.]|nr:Stk1 family PASTA domain-containing Ser/Thr kinase [Phycicoccus sp.]